jgi:hypothetical protein
MKEDLINKIKSHGYWRINFQPVVAIQKLKALADCRNIVEKNSVSLRGWNYPHFPQRQSNDTGIETGNNFYQGWTDWECYKEFWRMYQSGQFLHYLALREDWWQSERGILCNRKDITPGTILGVIMTTYQITEIYEFLSRLARNGIYDEGVIVNISLNNTLNRKLWIDDPRRMEFSYDRVVGTDRIELPIKRYRRDEIIVQSKTLAFEAIIYIFERFSWDNPPIDAIKKDQEALLTKNFR